MGDLKSKGIGLIKFENNQIIIIDPKEGNLPARILPSLDVAVIIDGKEVSIPSEVHEKNKIELKIKKESIPKREIILNVSEDKMEARITIKEEKSYKYKIRESSFAPVFVPALEIEAEVMAPRYTEIELLSQLSKMGIIYGLDNDNIRWCCNNDMVENVIIAKGKKCVEPIDDKVTLFFDDNKEGKLIEDEQGNVDFKSIGNVANVKTGELIGQLEIGKNGEIGFNVYGQVVKPHRKKEKKIFAKDGCRILDNKVYATIDGRPNIRGTVFSVEKVLKISGDVDISKGNVSFIGDVIVSGDVKEDMKVESGNNILVNGNTLIATLIAEGDIEINGNVISTNICGGNFSAEYIIYVDKLEKFYQVISNIYENLIKINHRNLLTTHINEKELINAIIDSRFKNFNMDLKILINMMEKQYDVENEFYRLIKSKMYTTYFSSFESIDEIKKAVSLLEERLYDIKSKNKRKSDLYVNYVQNSTISMSGSIYVNGQGIYKSEVTALDSIYFLKNSSIMRGGVLVAENEIKAKIVGTPNAVQNILKVKKHGHIYVDNAYYNTKFIVGNKIYVLEENSRDVHVYLDKDGEICVEKLKI